MAENLGTLGTAFIDIVAGTDRIEGQMAGLKRTVGNVAASLGLVLGAAGVVKVFKDIVGAASDFESSFAGIRKTLDASDAEFQAMSDGMRQLAKEIPVPVNELNKIGETAGQLGIAKEGVLEFTRVIAAMSVATNLSSDAAATGMAKLGNLMGDSASDFDRMGSAINELGAAGSATESEILNMSIKFATAGKLIGLSTPQVLGFAAAMVGVGVEAEAGGTALSKTFSEIQTAVATGGKELSLFAKIALPESNDAVKEFATLFRDDAAGAIQLFVEGLKKLDNEDAVIALTNLGIVETRQRNALLALSEATVGIGESLKVSAKGYQENTSLMTELEKRTQTFESQMQLLKSSVNDLAISAGTALLPALKDITVSVRDFIESVSKGEGPIIGVAFALGSLAGGFALVKIAGFTTAVGLAVKEMFLLEAALAAMAGTTGTFAIVVGTLTKALTILAAAPLTSIIVMAGLAYELSNLFDHAKQLIAAQGNLAVSNQDFETATIKLYGAIKDKYNVEIPRAGRTTAEWNAELVKAGQALAEHVRKTQPATQASKDKGEADAAAAARAAQLTEAQKKLNAEFQAALKPADDLNAKLEQYKGATDAELIAVYRDQILSAAEAQREHGFAVSGAVARLEAQITTVDRAKAAHEAMNNVLAERAKIMESFRQTSESFLESIAPRTNLSEELGPGRTTRKAGEDRLKELDSTVGARAADAEEAAREQIRQTTQAVIRMYADEGASTSEVLARLGADIDKAAASSKQFGVELNPTVEALIRARQSTQDNQKATEDWNKAWSVAMGNIVSDFSQAVAGVILGGKSLTSSLADIGKQAGHSFISMFVAELTRPLTMAFQQLGKQLATLVGGILSPITSGIGTALGGIIGIGGKAAPAIAGGFLPVFGGVGGAAAGTAAGGAGLSAAMVGLATNPITIAAAAAIGSALLISKFTGGGRKTANKFGEMVENPFGEQLDAIVSAFNQASAAGTLTLEEAAEARAAVSTLIASFSEASTEFASQGDNQSKVVAQAQARMEDLFGPSFKDMLGGLDTIITDLESAAKLQKEIEEALAEQLILEGRFQSALKPADELNEELIKLAAHSQADLVSVYGREILAAARAQREHGYEISGMVAELEPLAAAFEALTETATAEAPKWQPRIASNITDEQRAALGLMAANQASAATTAAAIAASIPSVAMNLPGVTVAQDATRIFSEATNSFSGSVARFEQVAAAVAGGVQVSMPIEIHQTFEITDGADPQVIREKTIPEITKVLETGLRGIREKWTQLFRDTSQGITSTAISTT